MAHPEPMSTPHQTADEAPDFAGTENYRHYERGHQIADFTRTWRGQGLAPGAEAPDFELESATGERIRLRALRGRPVVLHFGSLT